MFEGIFNQWQQQQRRNLRRGGNVLRPKLQRQPGAVAELFQGNVVAEQRHFVAQRNQRRVALLQHKLQQSRQAFHHLRGLVRLLERQGVQVVEGIEQKMWANLGLEQLQLGLEILLRELRVAQFLLPPLPVQVQAGGYAGRGDEQHVGPDGDGDVVFP